ncbi:hypothetical protein VTN00DRAFT_5506 [Thermoascus crustaceus]|uniref:uncharacterized protein n=1 Tax=Thermoascus crustaceus TaxID=5088 RepID=UPI0037444E32
MRRKVTKTLLVHSEEVFPEPAELWWSSQSKCTRRASKRPASCLTARSMDPTGSEGKKPIPKFTSFKPKPAPHPERDRSRERRSRESPVHAERDEKSRHRHRHRSHRDRSRSRDRSRERDRHRHVHAKDDYSRPSERHDVASRPKAVVKHEEGVPDLFVVDRKGDPFNVQYGTPHRYSIPQYQRTGRGSVLGLPSSYKIDRDASDGAALIIRTDSWRADGTRIKSKSILSKLNRQGTRILRVRREAGPDTDDAARDFLPLDSDGSRKRRKILGGLSLGDSESDEDKYAYRSIEGKAKPDRDLPGDLEVASETDVSGDEGGRIDLDEEVKQRNVELSRRVEERPDDIDAWVQLIDHQDVLVTSAQADNRRLTYAEMRSLADIKLSLYDKALKRVGPNASKDRLLLGFLEEGAKVWDTKKLADQWHAILKANSHYISLWVRYLDFRQTEFLDFTYERCRATFLECMKLNASSPDGPEKPRIQTYLFLLALWQAILEFVFFRPDSLNRSDGLSRALSSFREFWESEVARIGEVGAKGWKSGSNAAVEPRSTMSEARVNLASIFPSWLQCEKNREIDSRLPARALDEVEDIDPYRVVLFEDIEDILALFWGLSSTDILVDGFLCFCRLPSLSSHVNSETTRYWCGDSFLRNELMEVPDSAFAEWFLNTRSEARDAAISPGSFPQNNFIHTLDTLFTDENSWFSSLKLWKETAFNGGTSLDPGWVRRTLRSLVDISPANDDLTELSLAVEFVCNVKEAKKYAKSLLKRRSSNLRLYNVYALMECRSGNNAAADKVWTTTLSMGKSFTDRDRLDCALLWRTWLWESLTTQDVNTAIRLLIAVPQNNVDLTSLPDASNRITVSPAEFLKTQRFLAEAQEHALTVQKANVFVAYTECLALLFYLTRPTDLDDAVEVYKTALERLSRMPSQSKTFVSFTTELLYQAGSELLYHHAIRSRAYKPSRIRAFLAESISLFPHNTMFLSLFAWNESRFRIDDRVRDVMRDITATTTAHRQNRHDHHHQPVPVTSHLFSIYTELHRPVFSGSTLHSVRAAFEKAIGHPALSKSDANSNDRTNDANNWNMNRSNLSLWKLYILFELSHNEINRAKEIFYRGMRACPWSKGLVMLAFSHLSADAVGDRPRTGDGMGFEELRRVYRVLIEKELRVHVDIEGALEEVEERMMIERRRGGSQEGPGGRGETVRGPINMPEDADSGDERDERMG